MSKYLSSTAEYTIQVQIYIYIAKYETNSLIQYEDINKQSKYIYIRNITGARFMRNTSPWVSHRESGLALMGLKFSGHRLETQF